MLIAVGVVTKKTCDRTECKSLLATIDGIRNQLPWYLRWLKDAILYIIAWLELILGKFRCL